MNKTYIEPKVRLIDRNRIPKLGFYLWMKSRQWIIRDDENVRFMTDMEPDEDWFYNLPNQFYVGDEFVSLADYVEKIENMNLQYNNSEYYVFEIDGSCLFRDMLFNLNRAGQWAQSNRFLFSILDENERYNSKHYHISAEYRNIPEWEEQFDKYMEAIKNDPIVDHNRLEMPYSVSSTFWISINWKTLCDFISFLKFKAPFFYEVYGLQFAEEVGYIPLNPSIQPSISQYIIKHKAENEGMVQVGDTIICDTKMALILYSQFLRQSDTLVSGFLNEVMHENLVEFSHKVFKGSTTFMIHYVADETKAMKTVSNRLCAFAMSSGTGPESWTYFLTRFLPKDFNGDDLKKLLPCTFDEHGVSNCKFREDIRFRNEGKEISNCPCPLVTRSLENAIRKKERDNNIIGDAYFDLTNKLLNN